MIKAVRGTRDLLPPETAVWNFVESIAREVFRAYNFQEIRTPIFENTELFARGVGEETDIVAKEMYTWEDRSRAASEKGQSLTLRPEATAGIVRAYTAAPEPPVPSFPAGTSGTKHGPGQKPQDRQRLPPAPDAALAGRRRPVRC